MNVADAANGGQWPPITPADAESNMPENPRLSRPIRALTN
jgi:hypothetical protein